jgi:hypothetical protein
MYALNLSLQHLMISFLCLHQSLRGNGSQQCPLVLLLLAVNSLTTNYSTHDGDWLAFLTELIKLESKICHDQQSVGQSFLVSSHMWGPIPIFVTVRQLQVCWYGAPSLDEWTGLSFTIVAGPHQRSHSQVWVLWDSWPYFTVSDSRLPQPGGYLYSPGTGWPSYTSRYWVPSSSPPMTRRATVEVFKPAYTWTLNKLSSLFPLYIPRADPVENTVSNSSSLVVCVSFPVETSCHMLFTGRWLAADCFSC